MNTPNDNTTFNINLDPTSAVGQTPAQIPHVTIDTKQMQSELERRQQELEAKAKELAEREEALRQAGNIEFRRQPNWPPLPSFCCVKPCFFQDINVDIKPEFQNTVQLGYNLWVAFVGTLLANLIGAITILSGGLEDAADHMEFALLVIIFFVPISYVAWFRSLYKAFKDDSSFSFMVYFFTFFIQTMLSCMWAVGLLRKTSCGLFVALSTLGGPKIISLILFFVAFLWTAYAIASVLFLIKVHRIYRSSGATMAKAKSEFAQGIISNQYVQRTVATAATNMAQQAASGGK